MADEISQMMYSSMYDRPLSSSELLRAVRSLDHQISHYIEVDRPIWSSSEDSSFLQAVDSLLSLIRNIESSSSSSEDRRILDRADDLLQQAMFRLKDEFRALIDSQARLISSDPVSSSFNLGDSDGEEQIPVAQPVADYNLVIDALPSGTIADLHDIAKRMITGGFQKECAQTYSLSRRDFLEESISRLGFRLRTADEIRGMTWSDLEEDMDRWIKVVNVAVRILFHSERRLCDRVFAGLSAVADLSLAEICSVPAMQLLGFADAVAVAVGNKAPERLFKVLDLYEALRDLIAEIDFLFSDQYSSFLRFESVKTCNRLAGTVRGIFTGLENLIRKDPVKSVITGSAHHPITSYVLNYLRTACESRQALEEIMYEDEGGPLPVDRQILSSSLSVRISWIVDVLQENLEAKARLYCSPGQNYFFLLNNGQYMVQKTKNSEVRFLLGEDWFRRQTARVQQWRTAYLRAAWGRIVDVLKISSMTSRSLRDKLHMFNVDFEEICRTQKSWIIADESLRSDLRILILKGVLPVYQSFLDKLKASESAREMESLIKYSPERVEACINELFQGRSS